LVWVNAYWVNIGDGKLDWLNTYVEKYDFPLIGQTQKTLENLLRKDECQSKLNEANIPIPQFVIIQKEEISATKNIILNSGIDFPIVVKPTNESRSSGVKIIKNIEEASEYVKEVFDKYPEGNVIIEEFLPKDDITCGYIQLNGEVLLLPSYLVVEGVDCKKEIYGEEHYLLSQDAVQHTCVHDKAILTQLKEYMSSIVNIFEIKGITRIDSRANKDGQLRFFDTNGMPGLNYPSSAIIKQCCNHFPDYSQDYIFECLINTIVLDRLIEYNFSIPKTLSDNNLFNLKSETAIKLDDVYASVSYS